MTLPGFEELDSTKVGREGEYICRRWLEHERGWEIESDTCEDYDTQKDLIVSKEGQSIAIEIKADNYPRGNNLALEYMQQSMSGEMKLSGLSTTRAEYIFYYIFRWDMLCIFKKDTYDSYLKHGYINDSHSKTCNAESGTGKTKCYVVGFNFLKEDGFLCQVIEGVSKSIDMTGVAGIMGGQGGGLTFPHPLAGQDQQPQEHHEHHHQGGEASNTALLPIQ